MSFLRLKEEILDPAICTGCGICTFACPVSCIHLNEKNEPMLLGECNSCGLCIKLCPRVSFDCNFSSTNKNLKVNPFVGCYENIYFGRAAAQEIRNKGSGGGIVSAVLVSALQKGLVEGSLVVEMSKTITPFYVISQNKEQVIKTAQSKYIVAPLNQILKHLKSKRGQFVLVALPCQVHAIRKLQREGPEWVSKKIKYVIGLFCASSLRRNFLDYLFWSLGVKKQDAKELQFRHRRNLTTSSLLLLTRSGSRFFIDRKDYSFLFYLFPREACLYCTDHTNEFADISVGDMRPFPKDSPNYEAIEPLQSVIIVRTKKGVELLRNTDLILFDYDVNDLIASKLTNMIDKKICSRTRMQLQARKGLTVPIIKQNMLEDYTLRGYDKKICPSNAFKAIRYAYEIAWLEVLHLTAHKTFAAILSRIPLQILKAIVSRFLRYKTWGLLKKSD